jgi:glycosyltransferase involved in cell wall biosynthesis
MRGKWDLLKIHALAGIFRRERFDLVHTHLFHADVAGRLAAIHAAVPHVVHSVHVAEGRFRPWQFFWARMMADVCDRIVAVSYAVRDFHSSRCGLPADRYTVIPNGIDASAYRHDPAKRHALRRRLGLTPSDILVAFVGRLDHQKGIDVLLSAASHLGARGKPIHLVIAGDGPQRSLVENFIAHGEGGRFCRWLGFYQDVQGVLSAADLFALPSRWEGFGLAAAEAMAAGLPVIATSVPGLQEVLDFGRAGAMIPSEDVITLTEAIERLSAEPAIRRSLGEVGRRRVVENYSIESNIAAHERLYEEIAG